MISYFLFTRDLRINDNPALNYALKCSASVTLLFILTPVQTGSKNKYRSLRAIEFMLKCLVKLNHDLHGKLHIFQGELETVLAKLPDRGTLYMTEDYTPYAKKRAIQCKKFFESVIQIPGHGLIRPIRKKDGTPYEKFSPFFDYCAKIPVPRPKRLTNSGHFGTISLKGAMKLTGDPLPHISVVAAKNYGTIRDDLSYDTSGLSAYLKFGAISVREVYWKNRKNSVFIRQLWWREFYMNMFSETPDKWTKSINWDNSAFSAWKNGKTGVPLIDAAMICLRETGYLHNRLRMQVASFLVKILHVDWRLGERYFATQLTDYDYFNNRGGWLWCAGLAADSQPYFRYFNPYKFDDDPFVHKWLPENHKYIEYNLKNEIKKTISLYKKTY